MSEDLMRYDVLAQHALRNVVRLALQRVARTGLPGEHHFFISFDTTQPGVHISDRLRKRYPEEMTIVIQHQFWNMQVLERHFQVELSFDNIPELLVVPYTAIKGFFDPSVQFGLQFEAGVLVEEPPAEAESAAEPAAPPAAASNDDSTVVSLDAFRKK